MRSGSQDERKSRIPSVAWMTKTMSSKLPPIMAWPEIDSPMTHAASGGLSAVSPSNRSAVSGLGNRRPPSVIRAIAAGKITHPSTRRSAKSSLDTLGAVPAGAKVTQPRKPPQAAVGTMSNCFLTRTIVRFADRPREQHSA